MPSPFPGMNPYLEHPDVWPDFHNSYLTYAREVLNAKVGDRYFVGLEEQIYVHELPEDQWRPLGRADVAISDAPTVGQPSVGNVATIDAPHKTRMVEAVDTVSLPFLEIRDRANREVITIIEVLSPSNKRAGPDRAQYAQKRITIVHSAIGFVEIDLLRGGKRHSFAKPVPQAPYYVFVSQQADTSDGGYWPVQLRDPLPEVSIPLRQGEPSIPLDLQELLHRAYDSAGYHKVIYRRDPDPPLSPEDAAWAQQFVPRGEPGA